MQSDQNIIQLLLGLWRHVSQRRRVQYAFVLVLMIFTSFLEMLSIGAVLPFLSVLTAPERIFGHPQAQPLVHVLGITSANQLILPLTIIFGLAAIVSGAMRLLMLLISTRLSYATVADLSMKVYRHTLYQPYAVHIARNSSDIIAGISSKTGSVIAAFVDIQNFISSSLIFVSIVIVLLSVDPVITLMAIGGFGLIYGLIMGITRSRLIRSSQVISRESNQMIKLLQEAIGGIRDILIDGSQGAYCRIFHNSIFPLRRAQGNVSFLSSSPKFAVEALGMLLIAGLAYSLSLQPDGLARAIPVLGVLALGAQRMLPLLQQAYRSWSGIQGDRASLQDALALLDQRMPDFAEQPPAKPLPFSKEIRFQQLSFRYSSQTPWVLKNLDFKIPKGSRVGFIGATGSGKSTLLDIIMGLLQPTKGTIEVDNQPITVENHRDWQAHIAHVPQSIFLADSSIEENIAFGIPKNTIDHDRVRKAACQAQIADLIESWPEKYKTAVGERGIRLSGGQRQRIGIARALYKKADVIIFDEATSALDNETEKAVMDAIDNLSDDLTILIVAHRLSTLERCTQVVELSGGVIGRSGSYENIVN